ncbi:MAG: AbrB/MazE/SpoVT family DNA-binding domain-containing protein [Spirochaetaceae bacterium]|nr:AbrB/MazE/SpoVT family DNA-binding domain-containing protein [Spirochaetaceae bacterium]
MKTSERGQITIPKPFRDRFGMNHNVDVEITPSERGLLIHKRTTAEHPVERVYAVLGKRGSTDDYIEEIRGR